MFSRARNVSSSIYQTLKCIWDVNKNTLLILACCKILNSWITDNYIMVRCNGLYNRLQRAKFLTALWFQNFIWIFIQHVYKTLCSSPEGECSAEITQEPHKWAKGSFWEPVHVLLTHLGFYHSLLPNFPTYTITQEVMPYPEVPPALVCQPLPVWWHCDTNPPRCWRWPRRC